MNITKQIAYILMNGGFNMTINDAKKVMLDRVNLDIEVAALRDEILAKEKQIKKLHYEADEMQMKYDNLANSGIRQFFLGLAGKKEARLQEVQNEVRRAKGELSSAEFDLASLKTRMEDIEQTIKEIESICNECLNKLVEIDGEEIKKKICAIYEIPRLRVEIAEKLAEMQQDFSKAYSLYRVGEPTASCLDGNANNRSSAMRKHSKVIADGVDEIIQLLNTYNLYAPDEIKIEFHDKWMDKKDYWENQQIPEDSLDRIKKVEDWFYRLDMCWKGLKKKQIVAMKEMQEAVFSYLDV